MHKASTNNRFVQVTGPKQLKVHKLLNNNASNFMYNKRKMTNYSNATIWKDGITFKPQEVDPLIVSFYIYLSAKIGVLSGVGQWKEVKAQLKLSGGFLKPGTIDALSFDVVLRAYVNHLWFYTRFYLILCCLDKLLI